MQSNGKFWSLDRNEVFAETQTSFSGLSQSEAETRRVRGTRSHSSLFMGVALFLSQFKNPVTLLLVFSLFLSAWIGEYNEATVIFGILFFSGTLSFIQQRRASKAVDKIKTLFKAKARVKRDEQFREIDIDEVVPGDIMQLEAGDIVAADALILELKDLYVNESALTGESFPSEKKVGKVPEDTPLSKRNNCVFKGTHITSGTATAVAVLVGANTELGKIQSELSELKGETAFEKGIRQFGYMLIRVALVLAGIILIVNLYYGRNPMESVLFALALSLGLAPEMLPAIVTITLSAGAKRLADQKVIVKRLSSIQNLGAIDVLCTDKTGTLTLGEVQVSNCISISGETSEKTQLYAFLNASFESGYPNPMDDAIRKQLSCDTTGFEKFDEVPYDFVRKRLSIVVLHEGRHIMITKGALKNIIEVCTQVEVAPGQLEQVTSYEAKFNESLQEFSKKGLRTIGLCYKDVTDDPLITKEDETAMIFLGYVLLADPPKKDIAQALRSLLDKKVTLKVITGDNTLVAQNIAQQIRIPANRIMSGGEMHTLSDEALSGRVSQVDIFSETEPSQKERIIRALQKNGHVVGYLGDGINDASALKASDVGVSVHNAVDIARESADMILLEKDLEVMSAGIVEGRKTYLNTLKYIFITISANFGNMFSMALASFALPFFPLLPAQVLITNFLTDVPALAIASDHVDEELLMRPRKWNVKLIRQFMFVFGFESSIFDILTFLVLLYGFHAAEAVFQTGWFVESVLTEIMILLVIRTHRSLLKSKIGTFLLATSLLAFAIGLVLPYLPGMRSIGFVHLPLKLVLALLLITLIYTILGELTKKMFFRKIKF